MDAGGGVGKSKRQKLETPQINDKETSDVVILLMEDGEELNLYAHKAVLTRYSDYFGSCFSEQWNQDNEKSMTTIDTSGKGGIAKYEKFFQFIYNEPITVASLDLDGIIDMLEIALELSCDSIVSVCDHYLACVYWPEADRIGARLTSLCDKFKCSEDLAARLVEYGHPGRVSTLQQTAVVAWQKAAHNYYQPEGFARFLLMTLPIMPEEFVAHKILPHIGRFSQEGSYGKMLTTILERSLSKESDASNHLLIAKGLVHCARRHDQGRDQLLNQLVQKLGEVEQWEVFVEWASGKHDISLDIPNLHPSWLNFCQQFGHLCAIRDAAVKSWRESKGKALVCCSKLVADMMPEFLISNFAHFSEELGWNKREVYLQEAKFIFMLCSDMLVQVTSGKLLLSTSERLAFARQVMDLLPTAHENCLNYCGKDWSKTVIENLIKLVKTIPAEKRCDLLFGHRYNWPRIEEAFEPLQGAAGPSQ